MARPFLTTAMIAGLTLSGATGGVVFAGDRYLPAGETTHHWITYAHRNEASLGTFPEQATWPIGLTTRSDGRVAGLFPVGFSSGGPVHRILLVFKFDLAQSIPATIVEGPYRVEYPEPASGSDPKIWIQGAITEYTHDRYALIGYWQETTNDGMGGIVLRHHYYLLTMPQGGGTPAILFEFPYLDPNTFAPGEMAYLPAEGADPACFVISNTGGVRRGFLVLDTAGNILRKIEPEALELASHAGQCSYHGPLEALPTGELIAIGSDMGATSCPDWINAVAVVFDRYGNHRGSWAFGHSVFANPWYPAGFNAVTVLPSGHLYGSALFAGYYWEPTYSVPEYGDTQYHTYRHYLVDPPFSLSQPQLEFTPASHDFGEVVLGTTVAVPVTLRNVGSAVLTVSRIALAGGGGEFVWTGPAEVSLAPAFGRSGVGGTEISHDLGLDVLRTGGKGAQLRIESNDPLHPQVDVPLTAFGISPHYRLTKLLNMAGIAPYPERVDFKCFVSGGTEVLLGVTVPSPTLHTRLVRVPVVRGQGIEGLDTTAAEEVLELDFLVGQEMIEGPDGTLWLGPASDNEPFLHQILVDGTVLTTPLPMPGELAPRAFRFLPGTNQMLVARVGEDQFHLLQANARAGGGWDLGYLAPFGETAPVGITQLEVWVQNGMVYSLVMVGRSLWLSVITLADWEAGVVSRVRTAQIAYNLDLRDLALDPISQDLLLLGKNGIWMRLEGFTSMVNSGLGLAWAFPPLRLRVAGSSSARVRIESSSNLAADAWVLVKELTLSAEANEVFVPETSLVDGTWFRVVEAAD